MNLIQDILKEVKQYEDSVVITPLPEEKIEAIDSLYNYRLPEYFKCFLRFIGLRQDLIFGLLDKVNDFTNLNDFINSDDYFRFGDNGINAEYWLLKLDNENDRTVYLFDFDKTDEIIPLSFSFDDLLLNSIADLKQYYKNRPLNSSKRWGYNIEVKEKSLEKIYNQLKTEFYTEIVEPFKLEKPLGYGVKTFKAKMKIEGYLVEFRKTSVIKEDIYISFDLIEPISITNPFIEKVKDNLIQSSLKLKIYEIGIIYNSSV